MGRRTHRYWTPSLEPVEPRELLSLVTAIMAGNHQAMIRSVLSRSALAHTNVVASQPAASSGTAASPSSRQGFAPSQTSIALPQNQGPQGVNLVLVPTGQITPKELKRELFQATFVGPYTIGPGRFSSEAFQVSIRGTGRATTMLHCDIQMRLVVAQDPTVQNSGASTIFDRNLNSNTALGFDLASAHGHVDSHGRPNYFDTVSLDVNSSAGVYVEGFSQGILNIKYIPSGKRTLGATEQGMAIVKFQGQIYAPNTSFILRNSDINP